MLQPDAFCKHTMQQNATAAGAAGGAYSAPPDPLVGLRGRGRGRKGRGREREERDRDRGKGEGRGG